MVSAAGVTRADGPLLTIENTATVRKQRAAPAGDRHRRPERATNAVAGPFWARSHGSRRAHPSRSAESGPTISADARRQIPTSTPAPGPIFFRRLSGFYDDPDQPERRDMRGDGANLQAPDLVLEVWGTAIRCPGPRTIFRRWCGAGLPRGPSPRRYPGEAGTGGGGAPAIIGCTARARPRWAWSCWSRSLKAAAGLPRSALHSGIVARTGPGPPRNRRRAGPSAPGPTRS